MQVNVEDTPSYAHDNVALEFAYFTDAVAAGEMLTVSEPHLERNIHPTVVCRALMKALDDAVEIVEKLAFTIDFDDRDALLKVVDSCIATKFTRRFGTLIPVCVFVSFLLNCKQMSHTCLVQAVSACVSLCTPVAAEMMLSHTTNLQWRDSLHHPCQSRSDLLCRNWQLMPCAA